MSIAFNTAGNFGDCRRIGAISSVFVSSWSRKAVNEGTLPDVKRNVLLMTFYTAHIWGDLDKYYEEEASNTKWTYYLLPTRRQGATNIHRYGLDV